MPAAGAAGLTVSGIITDPIWVVSSPSSSRKLLVCGTFIPVERGVRREVLDEGEGETEPERDGDEESADMIDCETSAKRPDARFWPLESLLWGVNIRSDLLGATTYVSAPWTPPNFFPTPPIHDDTGLATLGPIANEPRPGTEDAGGNAVPSDVRRDCFTSLALAVGNGLGDDNDDGEDGLVDRAEYLNAEGGGFEIWGEDNAICDAPGGDGSNEFRCIIPSVRCAVAWCCKSVEPSRDRDRAVRLCKLALRRTEGAASMLLDRTSSELLTVLPPLSPS